MALKAFGIGSNHDYRRSHLVHGHHASCDLRDLFNDLYMDGATMTEPSDLELPEEFLNCRFKFWTCPECIAPFIDWDGNVATCQSCGLTNVQHKQRLIDAVKESQMSQRGTQITVEQALAAVGDRHQVHTLAEDPEGNGHLTAAVMARDVFACLIRMPTCKLTVAKQKLVDLKYPLRVETSDRAFYVFCNNPLCK